MFGQLGHARLATLLVGGLLHEAAHVQDAHAPTAGQLLLREQDEHGRHHHGHHEPGDEGILHAGGKTGGSQGLRDALAPDDEDLLGPLDSGEGHHGHAEALRDIVEQQRHDNAHERVAHGDEVAGDRRPEDPLARHEQKTAHDEHEGRPVQGADVEPTREEVSSGEEHRHDDGRGQGRVHAGPGGQLVLAQSVGEGEQGQKSEDLPRVGKLRHHRRGAVGHGQGAKGHPQTEDGGHGQDHHGAGHPKPVEAAAEEHEDHACKLRGRSV